MILVVGTTATVSHNPVHSGTRGCHNYFLNNYFFTLYVSSHLGRMVFNKKKVVLEPQWGKFVHGEIGQFSLRFWFPLFLVFFTYNAEFSNLIWPPVAIIYKRSPKPVLLGKLGESQRKLAEQKICPRRNWTISQFLVLKNRKNPFFQQTKRQKKLWHPSYSCIEPLCSTVCPISSVARFISISKKIHQPTPTSPQCVAKPQKISIFPQLQWHDLSQFWSLMCHICWSWVAINKADTKQGNSLFLHINSTDWVFMPSSSTVIAMLI
jgi:hypothetical protein